MTFCMTKSRLCNLFRETIALQLFWGGALAVLMCLHIRPAMAANQINDEQTYQALWQRYQQLAPQLTHNKYNAPIVIRSRIEQGHATGHVYAVLQHPFDEVSTMFRSRKQWCDATTLHINIKLCSVNSVKGQTSKQTRPTLSLFVGQKEYQTPAQAYRIDYHYQVTADTPRFVRTHLYAPSGPLDSKDYVINVEAIPLDNDTSFVHFSYSARYGMFGRLLLDAYLATLGRNKVGFTSTGRDDDGNPVYIKGLQGIIERNCMRYFLALQSYLDTASLPADKRFEASLNEWYGFTLKYKRQLYEVERKDYLDAKRREHANRLQLARTGTLANNTSDADF